VVQNGVMEEIAGKHPRLMAGLWFGGAALFPAAAIGVYYLLLLAAEGPLMLESELPLDTLLAVYLVLLPPLLAFGVGALVGVRILHLEDCFKAIGWGALVGVLSLLVWFGLGEVLALVLGVRASSNPPPALTAFGYGLAGLGSLALVVYDAAIGQWLWSTARGWGLEDTQPNRVV
jgi:hypothetical protein